MAAASTRAGLLPSSIRIGRVIGIPIGLHYSWFLIAALITFSLATHFKDTHPDWRGAVVWSVAAATAVLFFATLLAHELAHAIVAHARGLPVRSITLFALGGVASIERDAESAKAEFQIAAVGPIVSFAIGLACLAGARSLGWTVDGGAAGVAGSVIGWLGSINLVLAVFNLVPAYPLDGGRILRALLWALNGDRNRASRTAARVGQVLAAIFISWGLLQFIVGAGFGGLWLAFIGWFLFMAAQSSYDELSMGEALRGIRVADVMVADECAIVDRDVTLQTLVDDVLLRTGRRCVMVKTGTHVSGLVTPHDVIEVDRRRWKDVTVGDVMRPLDTLKAVAPATPLMEALNSMVRSGINQLPVIVDGRVEGVVNRQQILQLLQSRAELSKAS